jgi:hypothetical protein
LHCMFYFAMERKHISENPYNGVSPSATVGSDERSEYLLSKQEQRITENAPP